MIYTFIDVDWDRSRPGEGHIECIAWDGIGPTFLSPCATPPVLPLDDEGINAPA